MGLRMKVFGIRLAILSWLMAPGGALAALERVGPVDSTNGYPAWYQDRTGIALEFCAPQNLSELEGGWCLLLPGDTTAPEVFPASFFDEHFYFAAQSIDRRVPHPVVPGSTLVADLRLALEGAFLTPQVVPGEQVVFARVRIRLKPLPYSGTYTVYTPVGKYVFENMDSSDPAGIFFTQDIGLDCPPGGPFHCPLAGPLGPFLLPSAFPGGPEMPALTALNPAPDTDPAHFGGDFAPTAYPETGKAYIADPARIGPVTGSQLPAFETSAGPKNPNLFRIEGPNGFVHESVDFSLAGRLYEGTLPGRVDISRATYSRSATDGVKVDVFSEGFETLESRLPGASLPVGVLPALSVFDSPCTGAVDPATGELLPPYGPPSGAVEKQMLHSGNRFYVQLKAAVLPGEICVKDANARDPIGNVVPVYYRKTVADEVTITEALFDPNTRTLTVSAVSGDSELSPTLTLGGFGIPLVGGRVQVADLAAPPAKVQVFSSARGVAWADVVTLAETTPPSTPIAMNDSVTVQEDSGLQPIDVLANDLSAVGATVEITGFPRLGTAILTFDGMIAYTSAPNANGFDSLSYRLRLGSWVSNVATVAITLLPVNDAPHAADDAFQATANVPVVLNLVANDRDLDSAVEPLEVTGLSVSSPEGASIIPLGGRVTFTASQPGVYVFTYLALDSQGALSPLPATVTVTVQAQETLNIARAEYRRSGGRLRVDGTVTPVSFQTVRIQLLNSEGTVLAGVATVASDATGAWTLDLRNYRLPAGATLVRAITPSETSQTVVLAIRQ